MSRRMSSYWRAKLPRNREEVIEMFLNARVRHAELIKDAGLVMDEIESLEKDVSNVEAGEDRKGLIERFLKARARYVEVIDKAGSVGGEIDRLETRISELEMINDDRALEAKGKS